MFVQLVGVLVGGALIVLAALPAPGRRTRPGVYLGAALGDPLRDFFGRYVIRPAIRFAPQARHYLEVTYDVPAAAVRRGDALAYRLDLDPQGMVDPQAVAVSVRFPRGFTPGTDLPAGWTAKGRVATYRTDGLETSESFEVLATPAAG